MPAELAIAVYGYCAATPDEIHSCFSSDDLDRLTRFDGEYVIVATSTNETYIVSSRTGAVQYYYANFGNRFFHGETVSDVMTRANVSFTPDWEALGDLVTLGYTTGDQTLHRDVRRLPPGCVSRSEAGNVSVKSLSWDERFSSHPTVTSQEALDLLNASTERLYSDNAVVSMSGGFDSRLILSSLLHHGYKPRLLTAGFPQSSDVEIARMVAERYGLDLQVVELKFDDYLMNSASIAAVTNGTKTAENWHTYMYPRVLQSDRNPLFIGTNGEFARTYMMGEGRVALAGLLADMSPGRALDFYWGKRLKTLFQEGDLPYLSPSLAEELSAEGMQRRKRRLIELCHVNGKPSLLAGLDRFYLEQRVRHFMGNGLKLYAESSSPRTPFLDNDWVEAVWKLPRWQKMGAGWHRYAISRNYPDLMTLPEPGFATPTAKRAPISRMLYSRSKPEWVHYARYDEWFRSDQERAFVEHRLESISWLIHPDGAKRIVQEHQEAGNRLRLITLSYGSELARRRAVISLWTRTRADGEVLHLRRHPS